MRCGNCTFYEALMAADLLIKGKCHRLPPIFISSRLKDDLLICDFPVVSADDWCGEHKYKKD